LAAATFIDVDSGRGSALATNLAGAALIARHIILRNLAGPIVIDFIGMKSRQDRQKVVETLAEGLTDDPHLQLLGWTRLGHFELARKRKGVPLMELLFEHSALGFVKRPLTVALEALRALQRQSEQTPARRFGIRAHRQVAIALEFDALRARRELEARLGYSIAITDNREERHTYDIVPITTGNHHGT
jgi:Ribonuclease G/E